MLDIGGEALHELFDGVAFESTLERELLLFSDGLMREGKRVILIVTMSDVREMVPLLDSECGLISIEEIKCWKLQREKQDLSRCSVLMAPLTFAGWMT